MKIKELLESIVLKEAGSLSELSEKDKNGFYLAPELSPTPPGGITGSTGFQPSAYFGVDYDDKDQWRAGFRNNKDWGFWDQLGYPENVRGLTWAKGLETELQAANVSTQFVNLYKNNPKQVIEIVKKKPDQKMKDIVRDLGLNLNPAAEYKYPAVTVAERLQQGITYVRAGGAGTGGPTKKTVTAPPSDFKDLMTSLGIGAKQIGQLLTKSMKMEELVPFMAKVRALPKDQIISTLAQKGIDLNNPATINNIKSLPGLDESN